MYRLFLIISYTQSDSRETQEHNCGVKDRDRPKEEGD
jgi:hypothetical protein